MSGKTPAAKPGLGQTSTTPVIDESEPVPREQPSSGGSEPAPGQNASGENQQPGEEEVSLGAIELKPMEPFEIEAFAAGPTLEGKTTAHFSGTTPRWMLCSSRAWNGCLPAGDRSQHSFIAAHGFRGP